MSFFSQAGSAAGFGLGGLLGGSGSAPQINFKPPSFDAGGLVGTVGGGFRPSGARTDLVGGVSSTFGQQADTLGGLRQTVAPGFSQLREASLGSIENARTAAIGNLRDNLARRRILGSSFATDAISRAEGEFAQKKAETQAQSYLAELDASNKLIQQEFEARRGQFQTGLNELNLEASLAADLTGKAMNAQAAVAMAQAKLDAENAAGKGKFFGTLGQMAGSALGTFIGGPAGTAIGGAIGSGFGNFFGGGSVTSGGGGPVPIPLTGTGGIGSA